MVGGGNVFLHLKQNLFAEKYWINDIFSELMDFWSVVKNPGQCSQLCADLRKLHASFENSDQIKRYFLEVRKELPADSYRKAFLFFFFNRVTFSGTTQAGGFSTAASTKRFTLSSIDRLEKMTNFLANVDISCGDYTASVTSDGDDVFLFLDPPHLQASKLYGHNGTLNSFDHSKLAQLLKRSKHRFLLTLDDCPEVRRLYSWAEIIDHKVQYGMNNCNAKHLSKIGDELLISNYTLGAESQ